MPTVQPSDAPGASPVGDLLADPRMLLVAALVAVLLLGAAAVAVRRGAARR
jgi:hypothetical protein